MIHCSVNVLSQVGPLRCWPGGLCLSKSIMEMDVGEYIVPIPHVKQVKVGGNYKMHIVCSLFSSCVSFMEL
jgi:hypothetical protein